MKKSDAAYLAGLFDGEGCVTYRQIMKKRYDNPAYKTWDIRLEINMTHQSVIRLIHEMTGVGSVTKNHQVKVNLVKRCNGDGDVDTETRIMFVVTLHHIHM